MPYSNIVSNTVCQRYTCINYGIGKPTFGWANQLNVQSHI